MRKGWTVLCLCIWLLTFAGRAPEANPPTEGAPSRVESVLTDPQSASLGMETEAMLREIPETESNHVTPQDERIEPFSSTRQVSQKAKRNNHLREVGLALLALGIGIGALRKVRKQRNKKRRPQKPAMAKWLGITLGVLAITILMGLAWLASLAILGLPFALAGWFTLGIAASLVLCILLVLGMFWLVENADFDWPRGFLARVFLFIILIPVIGGILIVLASLSFFLFLNVFLVPIIGFFAAVAVMATMMSAIFLSAAAWSGLTDASEEE